MKQNLLKQKKRKEKEGNSWIITNIVDWFICFYTFTSPKSSESLPLCLLPSRPFKKKSRSAPGYVLASIFANVWEVIIENIWKNLYVAINVYHVYAIIIVYTCIFGFWGYSQKSTEGWASLMKNWNIFFFHESNLLYLHAYTHFYFQHFVTGIVFTFLYFIASIVMASHVCGRSGYAAASVSRQ